MKRLHESQQWLRVLLLIFLMGSTALASLPMTAQTPMRKAAPLPSHRTTKHTALERLKSRPADGLTVTGNAAAHSWINRDLRKAARTSSGTVPTIYGLMVYDTSWRSYDYGIYSYPATDGLSFTPVYVNSSMLANGGGVAVGDTYYYVNYDSDDGEYFATLYAYNMEDWTLTESKSVAIGCVASDMTYDPQTGNIYGAFISDDMYSFVFGVLDVTTGTRRVIASLSQQFYTLSADAQGHIYGIGEDGSLYSFNKTTGKTTLVGKTGYVPEYNQSATFDLATGTLYWSANTASGTCALFTVDTTTGMATMVSQFPNSNELVGTFIPTSLTDDDAPAAVENLNATFTSGSTQGVVTFTAPTLTYSGEKTLSAPLTYSVYVNDQLAKEGTTNPGELCQVAVEAPHGQTIVKVAVVNDKGTSPYQQTSVFVGPDAPQAVATPALQKTDGKAVLTWSAPTASEHGGYIDLAALTYDVVRYPDKATVATDLTATTLTDTPDVTDLQSVYYTVTAKHAGQSSAPTASNSVIFGESCGIPYVETFASAGNFSLFTVIDGFDDESTWFYDESSESAECAYDYGNAKDEWLITPALRLKADRKYKLSFLASSLDMYQPDNLEVRLGAAPTVEAMTQTLIADKTIGYNSGVLATDSTSFTVPADGNYHIGFHATNEESYTYYLQLDNIRVDESLLLAAPDSVSGLTVTPAALGALTAEVAFNVPTKNIGGAALQRLNDVSIYVNGQLAQTLASPAVGSRQSVSVSTLQGTNTILVVASNESGKGETAQRSVFTSTDTPCKPTQVVAVMEGGCEKLSWDAPTTGVHGGYVDPTTTTYTIARTAPGFGRNDIIAKGLTDHSFTDTYQGDDNQHAITYTVYVNGNDEGTASNALIIGGADVQLPFVESFPDGKEQNDGWTATSNNGTWAGLEYDEYWDDVEPQDGDGGFAVFEPLKQGSESTFSSARISLKNTVSPKLSFWYYHNGTSNTLDLLINPDQTGWQTVRSFDLQEGGDTGWQQVTIGLDDFKSHDNICFGFHAVGKDKSLTTFYVDNIRLADDLQTDLSAQFAAVPYKVKAGIAANFTVDVANGGTENVADYEVRLYRGSQLVATQKASGLASCAHHTVTLTDRLGLDAKAETQWKAEVHTLGDQNAANDTTSTVSIATSVPALAPAQNLTGERLDGTVTLAWDQPAINGFEPETEGFEAYKAFTIKNFGLWTMADVEGGNSTYGISDGTGEALIQYPNYTEAMAYQVFNPSEAGITVSNWQPHTGKQMLAAFCDDDDLNDDWLISPELSGDAQTIEFYAASSSNYYSDEAFEVLVSSTDTLLTSFTKVYEAAVPMRWDKCTVELPAGSRYFAIRHTTDDGFCFLLDDITYIPANGGAALLTLKGYDVYRDGLKLNSTPVSTTTYADQTASDADHTYTVTAVYATGEAQPSNAFTVSTTGISRATVQTFKATALRHAIELTASQAVSTRIYAASGQQVYSATQQPGTTAVALPAGVYLVSDGHRAQRIVVK